MGKMRNGKAGGESGILPEMVKAACCNEEFLRKATSLSVTTGEASRCWMWWERW